MKVVFFCTYYNVFSIKNRPYTIIKSYYFNYIKIYNIAILMCTTVTSKNFLTLHTVM